MKIERIGRGFTFEFREDLGAAVHLWCATASAARAHYPQAVRDAWDGIEGGGKSPRDLAAALALAFAEISASNDKPRPRGFTVEFGADSIELIWESDSNLTKLLAASKSAVVTVDPHRPPWRPASKEDPVPDFPSRFFSAAVYLAGGNEDKFGRLLREADVTEEEREGWTAAGFKRVGTEEVES